MLAPPWIPIPPPAYGGIEQVIDLLSAELHGRGHRVTLFAAPGTESPADVEPMLGSAHPDEMQASVYEADHVAAAFEQVELAAAEGDPYDVIHDHCGFTTVAFADRVGTPVIHTLHGPFTEETTAFYTRHGGKAAAVALSEYQARAAPPEMRIAAVIPNPIVVDDWPEVAEKKDYLLWIGRMNDDKGPQRAIAAAREADRPVVLAGPVQSGQEEFFAKEVEPHLDHRGVRYIGEVGGAEKAAVFAGASALLMPIRWPEPFGLVMTEAMASGTPVIAFPEGSACEIVDDGDNGFLVEDEHEMAEAVRRLGEIAPRRCREIAHERYDIAPVADAYERAYRAQVSEASGSFMDSVSGARR